MGKKYTTDEIEVGGHMLDASMMTSLNTVVTNGPSYLSTSTGLEVFRSEKNIDDQGTYMFAQDDGGWTGGARLTGAHNGYGVISMHLHSGGYYGQIHLSSQTSDMGVRFQENSNTWGPIYTVHTSKHFSASDVANGVTAHGWGDHSGLYANASHSHSYLPLSGGTLTGTLAANGGINMGNTNLTNVNHITINDPGSGEGIEWLGGNGWKIFESNDSNNNGAGNLQFSVGSVHKFRVDTSGHTTSMGSSRAPVFYDSNNTSYYVDPSATGDSININGAINLKSSHGGGNIKMHYDHNGTDQYKGNMVIFMSEPGVTHDGGGIGANIDGRAPLYGRAVNHGYGVYLRFAKTDGTFEFWNTSATAGVSGGQGTKRFWGDVNGNTFSQLSSRAPIFYDSNNTGYYVNPGSTSNLNGLTVNGTISGTTNGNVKQINTSSGDIDADWGTSFKTFDPIPSGTPPLQSPNIRTINIGENFARRTQLAFDYNSDKAFFRRRHNTTWHDWREFYHTGNFVAGVNYQPAGTYNTVIGTDSNINTSGAAVVDQLNMTDGVITSHSTRNLTAADIGASAVGHVHSYLPLSGGTLSGNLDVNADIQANTYTQAAHGIPRNNLGAPTVTEMALFDNQFTPKTTLANDYDDLSDLTFWKQETSSSAWVEITTFSDDQKRRFLRTKNSNIAIPSGVYKFRVEFVGKGYTFANAMYAYWSGNSHNTQVHVWKYNVNSSSWIQHTSSSTKVSSWPGHLYLPFSTIPWLESATTHTGHYKSLRIEFTPTWSTGTYSDRVINLYGMEIWGGYPSGRREPHYYDHEGQLNIVKNLSVAGDLKAPILYDYDDSNYYLNPASGSTVNGLYVAGLSEFYSNSHFEYNVNVAGTLDGYLANIDYLGLGTTPNTSGSYRINMGGNIDMNANSIDYVSQIHFNDNVRFYDDGNDSYLNFKYGDGGAGGIRIRDNGSAVKGTIYADTGSFGLLDNDGSWAVRTQTGTNPLELRCDNNTEFQVYNSYTSSPGSSRAPIFYDLDNTAYYLNPAGTSNLNAITSQGTSNFRTKRHNFGLSSNWDAVGFSQATNLHMNGHSQFWIGAGNGTWFTGAANTKSQASGLAADASSTHDLLITTMQGTALIDRGITFAVDSNGAGTAGWRLGKFHSGTDATDSMFAVDGQIRAKGGYTDEYDYYADDYSSYHNDGQSHWSGDTAAGWHKPSIVASSAIQIQSGNKGTNARKPQIQFHQYGYGGPAIEYDGPNKKLQIGMIGGSSANRFNTFSLKFGTNEAFKVNTDYASHNSDMRAPVFYDYNDTGYYVDPAGYSNLLGLVIKSGDLRLHDNNTYSSELRFQNNTHHMGIDYQNNETLRFITRSGATTVPITFQMRAGTITAANFILSSDERKKTKIVDLSCDNIDVSWKSFEMKDNEGEYRTGVIAQELEQKHPEFVNTNDEGFKSVKYIDLLIAKIAELEARLEKLEK